MLLKQDPFFSHSGSGLGIPVTQFSPMPARTGSSCQQALPFGASGSHRKLPGDGGLQLFAAALVFCAPKGGAVTFLKQLMAGLTSSLPSVA